MEILKSAKSALNFQDRYSDMEGSDGGYNVGQERGRGRKDRRALKQAERSGYNLNEYQGDRKEYLDTVHDERIRGLGTGITTVGGIGAGIAMGNLGLVTGSLSMGAGYLGGEMEENAAGNDGLNQQLGFEDAMSLAAPFITSAGGGGQMKQGGKLRYNPRKYDYIKGNTFGF